MQARSGRVERLFTPVPRLEVRGGFGRTVTGCREFGASTGLPQDAAPRGPVARRGAEILTDCIAEVREASPTEREGLDEWAESWHQDFGANPRVTRVIVDAMARYLAHLRASGGSPRALSAVRSDLNAAGYLVSKYDAPKGKNALGYFLEPPWVFEFERNVTDNPTLVARYQRNLEKFALFLRNHDQESK